jgi:hypothetical protein
MHQKRWIGACVCAALLGLSGCGGGGGGADELVAQTPFQVLVAQARSQPVEGDCSNFVSYSVLNTLEVQPSASDQIVEAYDRDSYHASSDCTGAALVETQLVSGSSEAPVVRITYLSSLPSAQVVLLDGRTLNIPVDRVSVAVNPGSGIYRFGFPGLGDGMEEIVGLTTTARFTINNIAITTSLVAEDSLTATLGMVVVNGAVLTLVPQGDTRFVQTVPQ